MPASPRATDYVVNYTSREGGRGRGDCLLIKVKRCMGARSLLAGGGAGGDLIILLWFGWLVGWLVWVGG
jgi:hypothetical protein